MSSFIALLLLSLPASAQSEAWQAGHDPTAFQPTAVYALKQAPLDQRDDQRHRVSGHALKQTGRVTTITGVTAMVAAVPTGFLVAHALSRNCEFECMGAPIFGGLTGGVLLTSGTLTTAAGLITSAVGRKRTKREQAALAGGGR